MTQAASLRLDNGLTVRLLHDAQAQEAAALLQVASGSDDEPERWPGLAHLLEHLLFAGSKGYQGEQRLMSWVPAQGGRLNATTRADRTACFFSLPSGGLEEGLRRLVDMLAAPLFSLASIAQEVEVIDAEYRLLSQDAQTLCGVAQRHFFAGPPAMRRFHVGSRACFGDDIPLLRQALSAFHQQHYHAGAMTLWLSGPQPLPQLAAIARRCGNGLPAASCSSPAESSPASPLRARADAMVHTPGATQFTLTFALNRWKDSDAGCCALLQQLLLDEAEGGLMAHLRALDVCDGVNLHEVWRSEAAALIAIRFSPAHPRVECAGQLEGALRQWLAQLARLNADQLNHYLQLAQRQFASKSALDRLRESAFGFAPPQALAPEEWQGWLTQLQQAEVSRLWLDGAVEGEAIWSAGFRLTSAPLDVNVTPPACRWRFWPFPPLPLPEALPTCAVPLQHLAAGDPAVLTLRATPGLTLSDPLGYSLQAGLRALSASLAHQGATLCVERWQGIWHMQLSGAPTLMLTALSALIARLRLLPSSEVGIRTWRQLQQEASGAIPVRQLLNQLPQWLLARQPVVSTLDETVWQAALVGGEADMTEKLARLLSQMPGKVQAASGWQAIDQAPASTHRLALPQGDSALLLFCPLPQPGLEAQLAWRLLALLYQPAFFQCLRVEQQIGYVVSCTFHQVADRAGVLFALQSPNHKAGALLAHIKHFLAAMSAEIARLSADELAEKRERLWQRLRPESEALTQARQKLAFPELTSLAARRLLSQLDVDRLLGWHQTLCSGVGWQQCLAEADQGG